MDYKIEHFEKFNDERGQLVVFLRNKNLEPKLKKFGQIYFVTFRRKNTIRGNHYHKKIREWFGVVDGRLEVFLKDVKTNETHTMILNGASKRYIRLEIGPYIAHAFRSLSQSASLINYTNLEWARQDTIPYKLL